MTVRSEWTAYLKALRPVYLGRTGAQAGRYGNKHLVEAVATLALLDTGLRSSEPGTILAERANLRAAVRRPLTQKVPIAFGTEAAATEPAILADRPRMPLAYHALSVAFLGEAIRLLGSGAPTQARVASRRAAAALAARTLERLQTQHGVGTGGLFSLGRAGVRMSFPARAGDAYTMRWLVSDRQPTTVSVGGAGTSDRQIRPTTCVRPGADVWCRALSLTASTRGTLVLSVKP